MQHFIKLVRFYKEDRIFQKNCVSNFHHIHSLFFLLATTWKYEKEKRYCRVKEENHTIAISFFIKFPLVFTSFFHSNSRKTPNPAGVGYEDVVDDDDKDDDDDNNEENDDTGLEERCRGMIVVAMSCHSILVVA